MNRKFGLSLFVILAAYAANYLLLSIRGDYKPAATNTIGIPSKYVWQPAGTTLEFRTTPFEGELRLHANLLGYGFLPLIWMDRRVWHPDKSFLEGMTDDAKKAADEALSE